MKFLMRAAMAVVAVGVASSIYQRIAEAADKRRFPPPGRIVSIGSRRMHILTMGSGSPAVVIVPALGANVLEWVRVLRAVAPETTVCAYDRAGLGWSDPQRGKVTIDSMADDLHALLGAADIAPPYVITGHSLGGVIARRFRSRYPEGVTGMLLVDSSHEDQARRLTDGNRDGLMHAVRMELRIPGVRRIAARLGLVRDVAAASLARETVPEYTDAAKAISLSTNQQHTGAREMFLLARPQGQPQNIGALPLTVLSAGSATRRKWRAWTAWCRLQDELAALSSSSAYMYAVNADHNVHLDDPVVVVQAIEDLVERCRHSPIG